MASSSVKPRFSEATVRKEIKSRDSSSSSSAPFTIPALPEASTPFEAKTQQTLSDFFAAGAEYISSSPSASSPAPLEYCFPPSLNGSQRFYVHTIAELFGLLHNSETINGNRQIKCSFPFELINNETKAFRIPAPDFLIYSMGYVSLMGSKIESTVKSILESPLGAAAVTSVHKQCREFRDGKLHHMTILSRNEVEIACRELKFLEASKGNKDTAVEMLIDFLATSLVNDWTCQGLGRVISDNNAKDEAFFIFCEWKSGKEVMKQHFSFLPERDFHITIGFKSNDVHHMKKDESTLISLSDIPAPIPAPEISEVPLPAPLPVQFSKIRISDHPPQALPSSASASREKE